MPKHSTAKFQNTRVKNRSLKLPEREQEQKKVGEVSHKKDQNLLMDAMQYLMTTNIRKSDSVPPKGKVSSM